MRLSFIKKRLSVADKRFYSDGYKKVFILDVVEKLTFAAAHIVNMYNIVKTAVFVDIFKHIPQLLQLFGRKMQSFAVVEHGSIEYLCLNQILKDVAAV